MNIITWKTYLRNSYYKYKFAIGTWRRAAKMETFIFGFSYNSCQKVVRVLPSFSDKMYISLSISKNTIKIQQFHFFNKICEIRKKR